MNEKKIDIYQESLLFFLRNNCMTIQIYIYIKMVGFMKLDNSSKNNKIGIVSIYMYYIWLRQIDLRFINQNNRNSLFII